MLLVAAVLALFGIASGCSCISGHLQQDFCRADFALKGVVTNITIDNGDRFTPHKDYTVYVEQIYKGEDVLKSSAGSEVLIKTPVSADLCGVDLHRNTIYLLLGSAKENGLFINLCNGSNRFDKVSFGQSIGLIGGYDCSCKIIMHGEFKGKKDRCYGPKVLQSANQKKCFTKFEMCYKVDNECTWNCSD